MSDIYYISSSQIEYVFCYFISLNNYTCHLLPGHIYFLKTFFFKKKKDLLLLFYVNECLGCMCTTYVSGTCGGGQKGASAAENWSYRWLICKQ